MVYNKEDLPEFCEICDGKIIINYNSKEIRFDIGNVREFKNFIDPYSGKVRDDNLVIEEKSNKLLGFDCVYCSRIVEDNCLTISVSPNQIIQPLFIIHKDCAKEFIVDLDKFIKKNKKEIVSDNILED